MTSTTNPTHEENETMITTSEAAELLGMKPEEISRVETSPAGDLIITRDGAGLLVIPDDQPDAKGQTGVMFAVAPSAKYAGTFPVYAGPPDGEAPDGAAVREELHQVREVAPPGVGGPTPDAEQVREVEHRVPADNSGDRGAGPSAASAAEPVKVDGGEATTHPDPDAASTATDPGIHDPAVGGPADAPDATAPLAGDGPVGTAVIAEVPSGTSADVLAWVGEDRGRAKQALAAERAASRPRSRLIRQLEGIAAQDQA